MMGGVKAGWFIPWLTPDRYAFSVVGPLFEEDISRFPH